MSWDKFEKLVSLVKQKVATIVLYRLKDPRVGFVTVTKIVLTRDLKRCTVHYSVVGTSGEKSRTAKALEDARGFIQKEVGKTLRTRVVPRVEFLYDESMEKTSHIEDILKNIKREGGGLTKPSDPLDEADGDGPSRGEE